jgi:phenylpyruvate tautomerase PptA (4-oxalocrotonate tautomerase family)
MPLYTSITQEGVLNPEQRISMANEITRIHTGIMEVPRNFVHVIFQTYPKGCGFNADVVAPTASLTAVIRVGHSTEVKAQLTQELWRAYQEATSLPDDHLVIFLQEIPASQAMEMGKVMADPGHQ